MGTPYYPPPQGPPGPGYGYVPPPPPQSNSGGCFKALGITCAVLLVLGLIGGVLIFQAVKTQMSNPSSVFSQSMKIGMAAQSGPIICRAIAQYKAANGTYPPNLQALVPQYLPDKSVLHSSLDPNPDPSHISWTYTPPAAGAAATTPMLSLPYHITVSAGGKTQTVPGQILFDANGQPIRQTTFQNGYGGGFGNPPAQSTQ
ncbi:MAG: hypothetical protein ACLQVD_01125 [Capsulimonadaceae bacterium]